MESILHTATKAPFLWYNSDQSNLCGLPVSLRITTKINKADEVFHGMMPLSPLPVPTHTWPFNLCSRAGSAGHPGISIPGLKEQLGMGRPGRLICHVSTYMCPFFKVISTGFLDGATASPGTALQLLIKGQIQAIIQ